MVCNIYNAGSVFTQHKSFSPTITMHNATPRQRGKEGKYFVLVSGLSMHLLGRAGSRFCLIKAWLMKSAAAGDGEIEGEEEREALQSSDPCTHVDTCKIPACLCLN